MSPAVALQPSAATISRPPSLFAPAEKAGLFLSEVLSSLSRALDMTEGQPPGHSMRCTFMGFRLGEAIGLSPEELQELFYALLLKDLGCSSNAARICALYLADDHTFKQDYKLIGGSLPQALRFVFTHTGLKADLGNRFRAILNILQNGGTIARELIETRCERGADIARRLRFPESVAIGIRDLDEHWDGLGKPSRLAGEAISPFARIALLAQVADVFFMSGGPASARREVANRSGTWLDPALAAAFDDLAASPQFWLEVAAPDIEETVLGFAPARRSVALDDHYLDDIATAFAGVIDAKSPYTSGHSERVSLYADIIAAEMGFDAPRRAWLRRTAMLHDIGKLGVSNQILDKAGKLNDEEWEAMRAHAGKSEEILSRIEAFGHLSRVAGAHHERLDGLGYPNRLKGSAIDLETRILSTADVFDALTAERPYRAAMSEAEAFDILAKDSNALDGDCVAALRSALRQMR